MSVLDVTTADFSEVVENSDIPVLVDFWAPWCGPCQMQGPILEQVAEEDLNAKIVKVNIDEEQELARKFNVMSIPTLYIFKDGEPVDQMVGLQSKEALINKLK